MEPERSGVPQATQPHRVIWGYSLRHPLRLTFPLLVIPEGNLLWLLPLQVPAPPPFLFYRGISRCPVFTRYPFPSNRRFISSAINTLRCCPPVHPNATVK